MSLSPSLDRSDQSAEAAGAPEQGRQPWFARLGRFSATHRRWVMIVWLVATLLAAPLALSLTGALSGAGWEAQGSTAVKVRDELRRDFPTLGAEAAVVVYRQADPIAQDPGGLQRQIGRASCRERVSNEV
jgi:RND superfamily putative drug exporter